jgi:hypothetical protein
VRQGRPPPGARRRHRQHDAYAGLGSLRIHCDRRAIVEAAFGWAQFITASNDHPDVTTMGWTDAYSVSRSAQRGIAIGPLVALPPSPATPFRLNFSPAVICAGFLVIVIVWMDNRPAGVAGSVLASFRGYGTVSRPRDAGLRLIACCPTTFASG